MMVRAPLALFMTRALTAALAGGIVLSGLAFGCGPGRARDVAGDRRPRRGEVEAGAAAAPSATVPEAPQAMVQPAAAGKKARLFVRASARALALDAASVYYGDSENDGIYAAPKAGGEPVRLARHAPVAGAIAVDDESVVSIASPGDAVLKVPLPGGGQPTTLRERGIFSGVAIAHGDVFITEAVGAGGALIRVTGPTAARLASFDGAPRAVMSDNTHAYVVTPTKLMRAPHAKGELETLTTGAAFAHPKMDDAFVYVLTEVAKARVIARVPKVGGPMTALVRDVRDAPFEVQGREVLFFDSVRPQVRAVGTSGGDVRVVLEDEVLSAATSLVADASTIYVATGSRESGSIVAIDRR